VKVAEEEFRDSPARSAELPDQEPLVGGLRAYAKMADSRHGFHREVNDSPPVLYSLACAWAQVTTPR
jgi:hypothetical protein